MAQLKKVLYADAAFLKSINVIDYSLLIIVIKLPQSNDHKYLEIISKMADRTLSIRMFKSEDGNYIYCLGVIDYLQDFNFRKVIESFFKNRIKQSEEASVTNPEAYKERFIRFCEEFVLINI